MKELREKYERFIFPLLILTIGCWTGYILSRDWGWEEWKPVFAISGCIFAIPMAIVDVIASLRTKITTMRVIYIYYDEYPIVFWIRVLASAALGVAAAVFLVLKLI
ncbi:hypothetical protein [Chitiniphilus shinanonensis]|uniref:hypothetical protein n=1 Tax=Chitiniphilus shinanonensis TaxID=553088 RepID=UPI00333F70DB